MEEITKEYTRGDVTVVWKPAQCIHSKMCWKGLAEVFDPRRRPWVDMNAADTEAIVAQVEKCPSGALSYYRKTQMQEETSVTVDTVVEVSPNGPLLVYGNISLKDKQGNTVQKHKVTAFCRCGASANKPYCDGSHVKIEFKDE